MAFTLHGILSFEFIVQKEFLLLLQNFCGLFIASGGGTNIFFLHSLNYLLYEYYKIFNLYFSISYRKKKYEFCNVGIYLSKNPIFDLCIVLGRYYT